MLIKRRHFLQMMLTGLLPLRYLHAGEAKEFSRDWSAFVKSMEALSKNALNNELMVNETAFQGLKLLQSLDINSSSFLNAVENSFETGNKFWLWQRLVKKNSVNGGILHIDNKELVQLHDHPGAVGMMRIIDGEVEVWQYNETLENNNHSSQNTLLKLHSRRVLKAGDTAVLLPHEGNIHALKSISSHASMLDFFIPPFKQSERSWYQPQEPDWENRTQLLCKKVSQHEFADI